MQNTVKTSISHPIGHQSSSRQLQLFAVKEVEVDGIPMGVLNDGTSYLTLRGLAKLCGINHVVLLRLSSNWNSEQSKPRGQKIAHRLAELGYDYNDLFLKTTVGGCEVNAYVDVVCMAILEYYAFDGAQDSKEKALDSYRRFAAAGLRLFIYQCCGYNPSASVPESWQNFHDRVVLNDSIPVGYFSVFREMADIVVNMIKGGCPIDSHTVPDISVGICWSKHWENRGLDNVYGQRVKHDHNYPESFPQSIANPVPAWIYPNDAIGEFRRWIYETYVPKKFPKYLETKAKKNILPQAAIQPLISAVTKEVPVIDPPAF